LQGKANRQSCRTYDRNKLSRRDSQLAERCDDHQSQQQHEGDIGHEPDHSGVKAAPLHHPFGQAHQSPRDPFAHDEDGNSCQQIHRISRGNVGQAFKQFCQVHALRIVELPKLAIVDTDGEVISGYSDTSACDAADAVSLLNECPASARSMVVDANLSTKTLETLLSSLPIARYALAVSPVKARKLITLAQLVDTLFCNRLEAASITGLSGDTPLNTLSDALGTCGFTTHVLTDGGADLLVLEDGTRTPVTVEGPQLTGSGNANGAGDALAGATIAACHAGQSLTSAVSSAGLAAARQIMTQA